MRDGDIQQVVDNISEVLDKNIKLKPGYYFEYGGQFENLQNAINTLLVVIPIALLLILLLLFSAFRSVTYSLVVFTTVPLSLIGGIVALWLRGLPFSISAGVGFIALFGVAVLNGILMLNHFNALASEGKYALSTSRIICHPQPRPFSKVIRSFIAEDQDYLDSRKVHVTYDMDDSLIAMVDEKEFQRIIFNLLTNTIKYRDKDISEVRISLHVKGKYAEFMYTDDGPGVPKEKLPHIFEAFYRTDEARSKTSNGSGLGLAIVAEIITAHKGRYSAVNNNGLQLIFEIPLAEGSNTQ